MLRKAHKAKKYIQVNSPVEKNIGESVNTEEIDIHEYDDPMA